MKATKKAKKTIDKPPYWEQAKSELMARDRILKKIISGAGDIYLTGKDDPFKTLARSIIGQQLSVKSAEAIWQRVLAICPECSVAGVLKAKHADLSQCGLSKRKIEYLMDLATHIKKRQVSIEKWDEMPDEEVIADLTKIRGIGRWTAEMFLIFHLQRPNVLPLDDVGLLKGISTSYFSGEPVSRRDVREIAANWEPWCTVATWYLWRSLTPIPVEY